MARLAAPIVVLAVVLAGAAGADLELRLRTAYNKLELHVTVYRSGANELDWSQLHCNYVNTTSNMTSKISTRFESGYKVVLARAVGSKDPPSRLKVEVSVEYTCTVQCTLGGVASNSVFYLKNNEHVFVVHAEMDAASLQKLVQFEFQVKRQVQEPNIYHLTSKHFIAMTAENDYAIWTNLSKMVASVPKVWVKSTKNCMPRELSACSLNVTSCQTVIVPHVDFVQEDRIPFSIRCSGNYYQGVDWDSDDVLNIESAKRIILSTEKNETLSEFKSLQIEKFCDRLVGRNVTSLAEVGAQFEALVDSADLSAMKALNTSNRLLDALDHTLVGGTDGHVSGARFAAVVRKLPETRADNGFVIYEDSPDAFAKDGVDTFKSNQTSKIISDAPSAAVLLPQSLLGNNSSDGKVAVAVFKDGANLFNSNATTSSILSVNIDGKSFDELQEPVKIWFRRDITKRPEPGVCVSWDFSMNAGDGGWSQYGCRLVATHPAGTDPSVVVDECRCWHLTHFGELFWDADKPFFENPNSDHEKILTLLTFIGCIVSMFGLSGVLLTALVAPGWVTGPGQKIQLQMSANLGLMLVLFMLLTMTGVEIPDAACALLGVFLHYALLSNFSWMLLAAYLQYSRLVKVVRKRSSRLLLKSGVIGWGLPLIPVVLIFVSGNYKLYLGPPLCLPRGLGFELSIAAPLVAIMVINLVIFGLIARSLYQTIEIRRHDTSCIINAARIKQLAFLFVLLGLNWLFAVLQAASPVQWLRLLAAYLFCFGIGSQGLVYFVFFVLMDARAVEGWSRPFRGSSAVRNEVHRLTRRAGLVHTSKSLSYSSNSSTTLNINTTPSS